MRIVRVGALAVVVVAYATAVQANAGANTSTKIAKQYQQAMTLVANDYNSLLTAVKARDYPGISTACTSLALDSYDAAALPPIPKSVASRSTNLQLESALTSLGDAANACAKASQTNPPDTTALVSAGNAIDKATAQLRKAGTKLALGALSKMDG